MAKRGSTGETLLLALIVLTWVVCGCCHVRGPAIVFVTEWEPGIHILNPESGEIKKIGVHAESEIGDLDYNERRNVLAFVSGEHERLKSIYIYDFSTKRTELFYRPASQEGRRYRPTFHPDGEHLFLIGGGSGVFEHDISTKRWRRVEVTNTKDSLFLQISFSKSGKRVALTRAEFDGVLIGEMIGDTIVIRKRILDEFAYTSSPRWIGDNDIVFSASKEVGQSQSLWTISLSDSSTRQLTHDPPIRCHSWLAISKDERWIVFTGSGVSRTATTCLWLISVDGQGLKQLTRDAEGFRGHFSPVWVEHD